MFTLNTQIEHENVSNTMHTLHRI